MIILQMAMGHLEVNTVRAKHKGDQDLKKETEVKIRPDKNQKEKGHHIGVKDRNILKTNIAELMIAMRGLIQGTKNLDTLKITGAVQEQAIERAQSSLIEVQAKRTLWIRGMTTRKKKQRENRVKG